MSDLCLSRDAIRELCRTPIRARQAAFLRQNGIRHYIDGHGWPVVLRSSIDGNTGTQPAPAWKSNKAA